MIDETTCYSEGLLPQEAGVFVPLSQYERYIRLVWLAETAMETVAEDWITGAEQGFCEPSEALKLLVKFYNLEFYRSTEANAKEAADRRQKEVSERIERELAKQQIVIQPSAPQETPAWPYKGIEITCDGSGGVSE